MTTNLVRAFEQAGVPLELARAPMQQVNAEIFQMDLGDRRDAVRVWQGARGNIVEALSADARHAQVLLFVDEPSRAFERKLPRGRKPVAFHRLPGFSRVLRETTVNIVAEFRTPGQERRFLVGRDESHLFVAQVREGQTVAEAHESLKPPEVRAAEAGGVETRRQGEWFFLPTAPGTAKRIERHRWIKTNHPIELGTLRPHTAERLAEVRGEFFACGTVSHADHRPLALEGWHEVVRNREVRDESRRRGILWVD